ncbi:MAG: DUF3341 domain-containing protein [Gemmatimonadaceae bacterium]
MRDVRWPNGAYVAEFTDEHEFVAALEALRNDGCEKIESYTPYPLDRVDELLPEPPSALPYVALLAGLAGGAFAYWIQWFANAVSYPLNIGGRPAHATPAFFIPTFEGTVLCASLAAFVGLLVVLRFPRPWHPVFEVDGFERAAIDRYWIAIDASDHRAEHDRTLRFLEHFGASRVVHVRGDE